MATLIVLSAAFSLVVTFKAYQKGSVATFCVIGIVGGILLNCLWGVLFLNEQLTAFGYIGIVLMLLAALLMVEHDGQRSDKSFWIYCILALILNTATALLSKQHQVETHFPIVDTLSFSVWIGIIRTVIFTGVALIILAKSGKSAFAFSRASVGYATASSVISGSCYIITLFTGTVLPIVVTSPLGTGLGIIMSSILPWVFYKEKLTRKQIIGILFSLSGAILFLVG